MDKERNMKNNADEKQWILVYVTLSKVPIRTAITSTTLMEGSTVQRCIFIRYVSNVQPEGGCTTAVYSIFIVWPIDPWSVTWYKNVTMRRKKRIGNTKTE